MRKTSQYGWLELIEGILLIVFAVLAFTKPYETLGSFVVLYGILAMVIRIGGDRILYPYGVTYWLCPVHIFDQRNPLRAAWVLSAGTSGDRDCSFYDFVPHLDRFSLHFPSEPSGSGALLAGTGLLHFYHDYQYHWSGAGLWNDRFPGYFCLDRKHHAGSTPFDDWTRPCDFCNLRF
jgi:hypothetical protein